MPAALEWAARAGCIGSGDQMLGGPATFGAFAGSSVTDQVRRAAGSPIALSQCLPSISRRLQRPVGSGSQLQLCSPGAPHLQDGPRPHTVSTAASTPNMRRLERPCRCLWY